MFKRYDLAIINRTFWPNGKVLGESLLRFGELALTKRNKVIVIAQHKPGILNKKEEKRKSLSFILRSCTSRSDSSSKLFIRILDSTVFALWVVYNLLITRPRIIYVATDPPIIIPFIVLIYSKIFNGSYAYHLQDIHPELTNIVVRINPIIFKFLKSIDALVIRHAKKIITITETMKNEIIKRSNCKSNIYLVDNPSFNFKETDQIKIKGFIFSGNLGRLQLVPLLLKSIDQYKAKGGTLPFVFNGGGLFSRETHELSKKYKDVKYLTEINAQEANKIISTYEWALLPIEGEASRYAFPSKTSSYLVCGSKILSISSNQSNIARWVTTNKYGINVIPNIENIVDTFFKIESGHSIKVKKIDSDNFSINRFVQNIYDIVFDIKNL